MADNCKKLPKPCEPKPEKEQPKPTPAFSFCAGDYSIHWNGTHLTHEKTRTTPDGTYGTVTVKDGCIIGYGEIEIPTYTPPFCSPNAGDTGVPGTSTPSKPTVSTKADNHLKSDAFGLFSRTYINGSEGITVDGVGTSDNPYVIRGATVAGGESSGTIVATPPIVAENRNNVTYLSLQDNNVSTGKYGPFTVSKYGTITNIDTEDDFITLSNFQSSGEIKLTREADIINIGLEDSTAGNKLYRIGAYNIAISQAGRVIDAQRQVELTAGAYKLGAYTISIDEYGSVTAIEQGDVPASAGTFTTADGNTVHYDETGRITKVVAGEAPNAPPPQAIRETHTITVSEVRSSSDTGRGNRAVYSETVTSFGAKANVENRVSERGKVLLLPDYVTKREQISIVDPDRAITGSVDMENRFISILGIREGVATISFRG